MVGAIIFLMFFYEKSSKDVGDQVNALHDKFDVNMTGAAAGLGMRASKKRVERAAQIQAEGQAVMGFTRQQTDLKQVVFDDEQMVPRLNRQEELAIIQQQHDADSLILQRNLIQFAQSEGMDVATYLEVLKTRALNEAEIEKIQRIAENELKAGFIYQLQAYQRLNMLRDVLDSLYERAYQIEAGREPEPVKRRKLEQVEKDIKLHEEDIGARRKRLLQAVDWEEASGNTEEADRSDNP